MVAPLNCYLFVSLGFMINVPPIWRHRGYATSAELSPRSIWLNLRTFFTEWGSEASACCLRGPNERIPSFNRKPRSGQRQEWVGLVRRGGPPLPRAQLNRRPPLERARKVLRDDRWIVNHLTPSGTRSTEPRASSELAEQPIITRGEGGGSMVTTGMAERPRSGLQQFIAAWLMETFR